MYNYCSDIKSVHTSSIFYAVPPKQKITQEIGPNIFQDMPYSRTSCPTNLCAILGIFGLHLLKLP